MTISLPVPGCSITLLRKTEIVSRLATTPPSADKYDFYPREDEHPKFLRMLHETWTPDVHPLTLEIARLLVGKWIWVVKGQAWWSATEKDDKIGQLTKLRILGVQKEDPARQEKLEAEMRAEGNDWNLGFAKFLEVNTQTVIPLSRSDLHHLFCIVCRCNMAETQTKQRCLMKS